MAAEIGNNHASTWTLDDARKLANEALQAIDNDCYFISSVAEKCNTYRDVFAYLLKKYNDDEHVFRTIKRMHNKCESIVMEKTAKGEINVALGIFVLKAYHGLIETSKQQIDHTSAGEAIKTPLSTIIVPDQATADKYKKLLDKFENE